MSFKSQPTSVRLSCFFLGFLLLSAPSIATDADTGTDASDTEVITILNPRHPSNPAPPDPTPDVPSDSVDAATVGCWLFRTALITGSPTGLAAALLVLGAGTTEEASAICSSR